MSYKVYRCTLSMMFCATYRASTFSREEHLAPSPILAYAAVHSPRCWYSSTACVTTIRLQPITMPTFQLLLTKLSVLKCCTARHRLYTELMLWAGLSTLSQKGSPGKKAIHIPKQK